MIAAQSVPTKPVRFLRAGVKKAAQLATALAAILYVLAAFWQIHVSLIAYGKSRLASDMARINAPHL